MAVPMKNGGMSKIKVMMYVILSGIATGIGALIGSIVGNISTNIIAICLAFAAGAMLYIVSGELIPESNRAISRKANLNRKYNWVFARLSCYVYLEKSKRLKTYIKKSYKLKKALTK